MSNLDGSCACHEATHIDTGQHMQTNVALIILLKAGLAVVKLLQ